MVSSSRVIWRIAMSHFLDRLNYFSNPKESFSDGFGVTNGEDRTWEDAYRNRWAHDKMVRSTHGVNYFSGESGYLGVGEVEGPESLPFLSEDFGPVATSTMPSRNNIAIMVSIIKVPDDASLRIKESI